MELRICVDSWQADRAREVWPVLACSNRAPCLLMQPQPASALRSAAVPTENGTACGIDAVATRRNPSRLANAVPLRALRAPIQPAHSELHGA